jgi:hypothetical protein
MNKRHLCIIAGIATVLTAALAGLAYAQTHTGVTLTQGPLQLLFVDEAVSLVDYVDDTAEPGGWALHPAVSWYGEGKANAISPSVHFWHAGQEHHVWPLHQSILQEPGDATVVSSGWVAAPTSYRAAVKDDADLVALETLVTIVSADVVVQTYTVTATAAIEDVRLIVYAAFDLNAPLHDHGEVTPDGIRVIDSQTPMEMALEGDDLDAAEVGSWNDGPYPGDDVWQHALAGELDDAVSATAYVEGALAFDLGDFSPGQAKSQTVTLTIEVERREYVYLPLVVRDHGGP